MQQVLAERIVPQRGVLADVSLILLGSLFVAAMAQLSIPLQPVPVTGQTFAVLLVGMVLGSRRGALALGAYLVEGVAGLPVFAEAKSGLLTVLGPTGGYLIGFIAAAWVVGFLAERGFDRNLIKTLLAMVVGNVAIYLLGLTWLAFGFAVVPGSEFTGIGMENALNYGLYPFLLGDSLKAILAAMLLPSAWKLIGNTK
jgi:biotin transport system substrate-specific component